jgi:hypothetical protein
MVIHSALLDFNTNVVLAISPRVFAIEFLSECMPDTLHAAFVHYPNYVHSAFFASLEPEDWPRLTWNMRERKFVDTEASLVTDQIRCRARLAAGKLDVIEGITDSLNIARYKLRTGVDLQDRVYLSKRSEAKKLRDSQYDEELIGDCPFVTQYADYADVSLKQAADDILLKAKFDEEMLVKTEMLRLRYFNLVRQANSPEQLSPIYTEFMRDCYVNARV